METSAASQPDTDDIYPVILDRADEARVHAEQMNDSETRRLMLEVGDSYEQIAKRAAERKRGAGSA